MRLTTLLIFIILSHTSLLVCAQSTKIENLGKNVNSAFGEIAPSLTPDGNTIYFVRNNHPSNGCKQAIWVSYKRDSAWSRAEKLQTPFNQNIYNSINSVSADGNTLLIPGEYNNGILTGKGYSFSQKTDSGWSVFQSIRMKGYANLAKGKVSFANLSTTGTVILMCFSPTGNDAKNDLFVSLKDSDSTWSTPKPLNINTEHNEITPFLAADGKTLYFASNRPGGLGKYDIYFSKRQDNTFANWSVPENMGDKFNTAGSEAYYALDARGEYAYLSTTNNSIGAQDIVRVKLEEEVQPDPVVLIKGTIRDKEGKPIPASISYEVLSTGKNVGSVKTDPVTGEYQVFLPYGEKYAYTVEAKDYFSTSKNIDLTETAEYKEVSQDFALPKIEVGAVVRINNIFFAKNSDELLPSSYPELKRLANMLNEQKKLNIAVSGHSDNVGSDAYNKSLSQRRAQAVVVYLSQQGVNKTRLQAIGYGESKPIADNNTEEGRAENRRVEFEVLE